MPDHSLILWIIGAVLTVTGLAGLLLPVIPGAPLLFLGLLCGAWAEEFQYVGVWTLLLLAGMTVLTYVVEFGASALGVRKYGGSRRARPWAGWWESLEGFRASCSVRLWGRCWENCRYSAPLIRPVGQVLAPWWDWLWVWPVSWPSVSPWSDFFS